jgi:hypothetical protein
LTQTFGGRRSKNDIFADDFPFSDSAYQMPPAAISENVRSAVADPT